MDFSSALDTKASDIERPKDLPQGTYIWSVSKIPTSEATKSGEWFIFEFPLRVVSPEEDVDQDLLDEFGSVAGQMGRISFMLSSDDDRKADNDKTMFRLRNFMQRILRVDCDEDATIREMLDASVNCQFYAQCTWRQGTDASGETVNYVDVKNPAPLD